MHTRSSNEVTLKGAVRSQWRLGWCKVNLLAIGLTLLSACKVDIPSAIRADRELQYNVVGGQRLAVPANYINSQSYGSMLVIASWPEMEGRTNENYAHFQKSNIRIHARPGGLEALKRSYRVFLMGEGKDGEHLKSKPLGSNYGFDHAAIRFEGADPTRFITHRDIYERRDKHGQFQAVMRCDGEPAPEDLNPQCQLYRTFQELPNIEFKISFDPSEKLDQVNKIERAVRDKFLEFKAAGEKAFRSDNEARDQFIVIDNRLESERIKFLKEIEGRCRTARGFLGDLDENGECK